MTLDFSQRLSVPEDVLLQELDGESVILNLKSECYFGLDEVGTRMWAVLTSSASIQDAYELLLTEYDVAPDVLRQDLVGLAEQLVGHGLLEIHGE
jgi:hypothetical protein